MANGAETKPVVTSADQVRHGGCKLEAASQFIAQVALDSGLHFLVQARVNNLRKATQLLTNGLGFADQSRELR